METIQDHLELVNRSKIQLDSARRVWLGQHSILYCGQSPTQTILEPPQLGQKHLRRDLSSSFARFSQPVTIIFLQNCLSVHIYLVFSLYQVYLSSTTRPTVTSAYTILGKGNTLG